MRPLVSSWRWRWIETAESGQTSVTKHSRHGGTTQSDGCPNLPARQTFCSAQLDDQHSKIQRRDPSAAVRSRPSIIQRLHPTHPMPRQPLIGPSSADACRPCGGRYARSFHHHPLDQQRSTCRTTSRILVNVHPGSFSATCSFGDFQDRRSRLDGQFLSVNNVLRHHN
jgi:hypothetical protein